MTGWFIFGAVLGLAVGLWQGENLALMRLGRYDFRTRKGYIRSRRRRRR